MKNVIMYYYGLEPNDIHQNGRNYYFFINNDKYKFFITDLLSSEITDIYKLSELINKEYRIIPNKMGKLITEVTGFNYILINVPEEKEDVICLTDILSFQKNTAYLDTSSYPSLYRNNWNELWSKKIDYFEYQINQFGKKYPVIRNSFAYFCGLAENAITYTNLFEIKKVVLSHKRIYKNMDFRNLYNPINYIVDSKVRDVVEYFKNSFFKDKYLFDEIEYYVKYEIDDNEALEFFARLLFPSSYFDLYEDILADKKDESILLNIIKRIDKYEMWLYEIYVITSKYHSIQIPEWLKKE